MSGVLSRDDPAFSRHAAEPWTDDDELPISLDNPFAFVQFPFEPVAGKASAGRLEVFCAAGFARGDPGWDLLEREQLAVGMLDRGSGGRADILKDEPVAELVRFGGHPELVSVGLKDQRQMFGRELRPVDAVICRFDDDFMNSLGLALFAPARKRRSIVRVWLVERGRGDGWELVGDDANIPGVRGVGEAPLSRRGGCLAFVFEAKGACVLVAAHRACREFVGASFSFGSHNRPLIAKGIVSVVGSGVGR